MIINSEVWGPHYWFFLHSVAYSYPETPNDITKRKYYELIQNMPLFIPDEKIGDRFAQLIDKYPVSPYLVNRESFMRWVHFIHNKINQMLGKEVISYLESLELYKSYYKPKQVSLSEKFKINKHYLYLAFIIACVFLIYVYY